MSTTLQHTNVFNRENTTCSRVVKIGVYRRGNKHNKNISESKWKSNERNSKTDPCCHFVLRVPLLVCACVGDGKEPVIFFFGFPWHVLFVGNNRKNSVFQQRDAKTVVALLCCCDSPPPHSLPARWRLPMRDDVCDNVKFRTMSLFIHIKSQNAK